MAKRTIKGAEVDFSYSGVKTLHPAYYVWWYSFNYVSTTLRGRCDDRIQKHLIALVITAPLLTGTGCVGPPPL